MANEKRLIYANEFKRLICKCCNILRSEEPCEPSECSVMVLIDEQPTVDAVEVVHGRWIKQTSYPIKYVCSECGHLKEFAKPYCELCGAKMDGGNEVSE